MTRWVVLPLLVIASALMADANEATPLFEVAVLASCVDADAGIDEEAGRVIEKEVASYVKQELRRLGDVGIASDIEEGNHWIMLSVVKESRGYCITATYFRVHHPRSDRMLRQCESASEMCRFFVKSTFDMLDGASHLEGGVNATCPHSGLKTECEAIVAHFDSSVLEPVREIMRELE